VVERRPVHLPGQSGAQGGNVHLRGPFGGQLSQPSRAVFRPGVRSGRTQGTKAHSLASVIPGQAYPRRPVGRQGEREGKPHIEQSASPASQGQIDPERGGDDNATVDLVGAQQRVIPEVQCLLDLLLWRGLLLLWPGLLLLWPGLPTGPPRRRG